MAASAQEHAQNLPPGWLPDGSGATRIDAEITSDEWEAVAEAIGEGFEGGFFSNGALCEALIRNQLSGLEEIAVGVIDFFAGLVGACPSADQIQPVVDDLLRELEYYCEDMSGIYPTILIANGCEIPAFRILDCKFTPRAIDPSCDGLRKFCEETEVFGDITPPKEGEPGRVKGYFDIPGCECEVHYLIVGDPVCEARPGPVTRRTGSPSLIRCASPGSRHPPTVPPAAETRKARGARGEASWFRCILRALWADPSMRRPEPRSRGRA